ncbi:hypothetical protein H0E84_05600 [Luteimonas sp. SJ-92]|uniref:Lipoprotein n=1 Tax=Luteimonas salinisoli TaxID=2752307 RepID=A0A853J9K8_9GAMM|nr:hypothetical protein [Luteimonas salinisoli]NZA25851.1 hypothetical protein [Luteimonas salinisoli]
MKKAMRSAAVACLFSALTVFTAMADKGDKVECQNCWNAYYSCIDRGIDEVVCRDLRDECMIDFGCAAPN